MALLPISIFLVLISLLTKTCAQFQFLHTRCGNITFTRNSTFESNLVATLNTLSTNTRITKGYYNATEGQHPNKIEAMVLCRPDVPVNTCRLCQQNSITYLPLSCPNKTQAFGYTDYCLILVSNDTTFHTVRVRPWWALWNGTDNMSNITGFNRTLTSLMSNLQNQASLGNSEVKSAAGETKISSTNKTLYGVVQCSPDLSRLDCVTCVQHLFSYFPLYFVTPKLMAVAARVVTPSCNFRYGMQSFYGHVIDVGSPPSTPPLPPSTTSNGSTIHEQEKSKKSQSSVVIVIPIVGSLAVIVTIASTYILLRRKAHKMATTNLKKEEIETLQSLQYSLESIKVATNNFSDDNYLGKGGFGIVYKGKLPDMRDVAVKRLGKKSVQGGVQFNNEILILVKLHHRNLVKLLGFCIDEEEMLLIYEFVINKSLDNLLFDPRHGASIPWETRYKIIDGIARGLLYLHEESRLKIIHRDLKAGNVLLDEDFNPKIADFGTARLFSIDQTQALASKIVGTYGYMAPEYVLHGHVSSKADVFSFGVLVLEIVSGQKISSFKSEDNFENMLTFAWKNWLEGKAWNVVDPTISPAFSTEVLRCIHIGLLCVQHNMVDRPTMSSVGLMLSSYSMTLNVPTQPAFFSRSHMPSNMPPPEYISNQSSCSINEVSMTQVCPR